MFAKPATDEQDIGQRLMTYLTKNHPQLAKAINDVPVSRPLPLCTACVLKRSLTGEKFYIIDMIFSTQFSDDVFDNPVAPYEWKHVTHGTYADLMHDGRVLLSLFKTVTCWRTSLQFVYVEDTNLFAWVHGDKTGPIPEEHLVAAFNMLNTTTELHATDEYQRIKLNNAPPRNKGNEILEMNYAQAKEFAWHLFCGVVVCFLWLTANYVERVIVAYTEVNWMYAYFTAHISMTIIFDTVRDYRRPAGKRTAPIELSDADMCVFVLFAFRALFDVQRLHTIVIPLVTSVMFAL